MGCFGLFAVRVCKHALNLVMPKLPKIKNPSLLRQALTHRSLPNHNERLEFIGDGILQGVVTAILSQRFPNYAEDTLSKKRENLVNNHALAQIARQMNIGQRLYLADNAAKQGCRNNYKVLSGALEALIGAYFIDSNNDFNTVERYVRTLFNL